MTPQSTELLAAERRLMNLEARLRRIHPLDVRSLEEGLRGAGGILVTITIEDFNLGTPVNGITVEVFDSSSIVVYSGVTANVDGSDGVVNFLLSFSDTYTYATTGDPAYCDTTGSLGALLVGNAYAFTETVISSTITVTLTIQDAGSGMPVNGITVDIYNSVPALVYTGVTANVMGSDGVVVFTTTNVDTYSYATTGATDYFNTSGSLGFLACGSSHTPTKQIGVGFTVGTCKGLPSVLFATESTTGWTWTLGRSGSSWIGVSTVNPTAVSPCPTTTGVQVELEVTSSAAVLTYPIHSTVTNCPVNNSIIAFVIAYNQPVTITNCATGQLASSGTVNSSGQALFGPGTNLNFAIHS